VKRGTTAEKKTETIKAMIAPMKRKMHEKYIKFLHPGFPQQVVHITPNRAKELNPIKKL
jgi:hypothetical protein